ncbi:DUF1622 domain-containing protein [Streptomyces sp900105755]|uniref:DUF1622 domain-containing protein n=1 Tax=Streptomyces sp. 900105755 TaxID=3154389 RepID=UPI003316B723
MSTTTIVVAPGRSILLGLEFLLAGDIIRTVAVAPTYASAAMLAVIVGIRTFLRDAGQMGSGVDHLDWPERGPAGHARPV